MAEEYGFEYVYIPTLTQQKVISVIGIPTAILSVAGSSLIIHHVLQNSKKTPYRRILLALSCCDIIATFGYIMQPFFVPTGYFNSYVWAFGNKTTCSVLGALTQFAFASHFYGAFLSFYFVSTIRYGMREDAFSKKYERWLHLFIVIWSVGTSVAGLVMDIFRANVLGPGCWVNTFPDECIPEEGCNVELIGWVFGGLPSLFCFIAIIVNNLILYCFVRQTVKEGEKKALQNESRLAMYNSTRSGMDASVEEVSLAGASTRSVGTRSVLRSSEKQLQRVRDVGKQSFLYVSAFFLCYIWSLVKHGLDGQNFDEIEGSGAYFLPLLILQAIFLPAQGFFNAIVYFRPKYMQAKRKYKDQSFIWYCRRSIIGEKLKPAGTNFHTQSADTLGGPTRSKRITFAGELTSSYSNSMAPIPETLRIPQEGAGRAALPSMLESTTESMFETSTEEGKE
ncbi:unnamed protein product [Cylindrotheca closterium]|uniref:G-protein coupled receptors family 1 profile domain-containing protein n=1 Tax=Cylindrotheca closterium TaxID=2856 RepID=A0AAD2G4H2_9STRA|nr:unnamed protein product [Cylindrotheca closterium]